MAAPSPSEVPPSSEAGPASAVSFDESPQATSATTTKAAKGRAIRIERSPFEAGAGVSRMPERVDLGLATSVHARGIIRTLCGAVAVLGIHLRALWVAFALHRIFRRGVLEGVARANQQKDDDNRRAHRA